jgi:hypothetical protein
VKAYDRRTCRSGGSRVISYRDLTPFSGRTYRIWKLEAFGAMPIKLGDSEYILAHKTDNNADRTIRNRDADVAPHVTELMMCVDDFPLTKSC